MFAIALPFLEGIGAVELVIILLLILPLNVLPVWLFWRVVSKAGFNPWLSFLFLVPVGELVLLALLAFQNWPALGPGSDGSALAPPLAPPGWLPDPTGRSESRYWDGSSWTATVSTAGAQAIDSV